MAEPWYRRFASYLPSFPGLVAPKEPSRKSLQSAEGYADPSRLVAGWKQLPYNPGWLPTRKGLQIYDQMRRDEQVKAALAFKKDTVLSTGWEVVSPGDEDADWEVTRFVRDAFTYVKGGWHQVLVNILSALDFGYSVGEKVYREQEFGDWKGKLVLDRIQSLRPHYIDFVVDEFGQLISVEQQLAVAGSSKTAPVISPAKLIIYTNKLEFGNYYGTCFSADTEVLTREGWKLFKDISLFDDEIATLNPSNNHLEYHQAIKKYVFPYKGKMFHEYGKSLDLLVTPNHKMWVKTRNTKNFRFIEARSLPKHISYKRDCKWVGVEKKFFELPVYSEKRLNTSRTRVGTRKIPMDIWLRFLGFWIADGCTTVSKMGRDRGKVYDYPQVILSQKVGPTFDLMKQTLVDCGFKVSHSSPMKNGVCNLCVNSDIGLYEFLAPLGDSYTKYIPNEFKNLCSRQLQILYDALAISDGASGGREYASVSKRLIDDVAEILLKCGREATVYGRQSYLGGVPKAYLWLVWNSPSTGEHMNSGRHRSWVEYEGDVYCLEVPNHIMFVRRNGKACWSGNSDLEAAYRAWWTKENSYKWLAITLERFGMPPLFALYDSNAYQGNQIEELKKVVKNIQNATLGVIPRATKDALEFWSQQLGRESTNIFLQALDRFDQHISRALLVPNMMGLSADEGRVGSLARSETHAKSFLRVVAQLQADVAVGVINSQVIPQLCDLNFPKLQSYPVFQFLPFTDESSLKTIETWSTMVGAGVVNRIEDDEVHIRKVLGFPENEDPELPELPAETEARLAPKTVPASPFGKPAAPFGKQPAAKPGVPAAKPKPKPKKFEVIEGEVVEDETIPFEDQTEEMKQFAEANDGVWIEHEGGVVCVPFAEWDESKHPRHPAGAPASQGGEFAPIGERVGPDGYLKGEWVALDPGNQPRSKMRGRPEAHAISVKVIRFIGGKYILEDSTGFRFRARRADLSAPKGGQLDYAVWDESKHPRGKTTPESRGGSFAPGGSIAAAVKHLEGKGFKILNVDDDSFEAQIPGAITRGLLHMEHLGFEVFKNPGTNYVGLRRKDGAHGQAISDGTTTTVGAWGMKGK